MNERRKRRSWVDLVLLGVVLLGSFAVRWPFVLASNAVVVAEVLLPWLLLLRPTRLLAAIAAIALMVSIQVGALEMGFAMLFTNLLLLFVPAGWNARLLPAFGLVLLWAVGAAAGWLPGDPSRWNLL